MNHHYDTINSRKFTAERVTLGDGAWHQINCPDRVFIIGSYQNKSCSATSILERSISDCNTCGQGDGLSDGVGSRWCVYILNCPFLIGWELMKVIGKGRGNDRRWIIDGDTSVEQNSSRSTAR
jgi:hypothetical protein